MGLARKRSGRIELRFWGVRGSHPAPGSATVRTGGNSVCMEVQAGSLRLVFDAGTGLIALGRELMHHAETRKVHVFLSHYHHDHIEGLRFFLPAYDPHWRTVVYGPQLRQASVHTVLARSMATPFFPVALHELPGRVELRSLRDRSIVRLKNQASEHAIVRMRVSQAHPKLGVALYRVEIGGFTIVYATDIEATRGGLADVVAFARGADVLVHDAQYTEEEYRDAARSRIGWGHSTVPMACEAARQAQVKRLFLYHHDPSHDDRTMAKLERLARHLFPETTLAREGLEIVFP